VEKNSRAIVKSTIPAFALDGLGVPYRSSVRKGSDPAEMQIGQLPIQNKSWARDNLLGSSAHTHWFGVRPFYTAYKSINICYHTLLPTRVLIPMHVKRTVS